MLIRFTTTKAIDEGQELCIFYAHDLWFDVKDSNHASLNELLDSKRVSINSEGMNNLLATCIGDDAIDTEIDVDQLPFEELKYLDIEEYTYKVARDVSLSTSATKGKAQIMMINISQNHIN